LTSSAGVAAAIARRLCRDAIWAGDCCNWIGPFNDSWNIWDVRQRSLGPELYSGTSGVALFLAAAAHTNNDAMVRKTARGAARHSLYHADDLPPAARVGVYSVRLGIAWALMQVGELLDEPEWKERGVGLLEDIDWNIDSAGLDLMSGYAGAIPVLLGLAKACARPEWSELALRLAQKLERSATRTAEGWSWKTIDLPGQTNGKNLTGFSHGAAGIGWALLETSEATGERRFQNAAEEAFRYERTHYSPEQENWPDFREFLRPPGPGTSRFSGRLGATVLQGLRFRVYGHGR
jgi:lantibiotic modifying enzyme